MTTMTNKKTCRCGNIRQANAKKHTDIVTHDYSEWLEAFIYTMIMLLIIAHGLMRWIG